MVTVAITALGLEYLVKILDCCRSRSRYIFTDSDSAALVGRETDGKGPLENLDKCENNVGIS
jgi:hypothetical protein